MPYVTQETRDDIEKPLEHLISDINAFSEDDRHGLVNYIMTTLVLRCLKPSNGWRYHTLQKAFGVFHCASVEFYRRLVAPYEDQAISNNGDLPGFQRKPRSGVKSPIW